MKPAEEKFAKLIVRSIAKAIKAHFVRSADHAALQARVAKLEAALAELKK